MEFDFNQINLKWPKDAQNNLNERSRKILGFKTDDKKMNHEIINCTDNVGGLFK
jgi:hypothetical protein